MRLNQKGHETISNPAMLPMSIQLKLSTDSSPVLVSHVQPRKSQDNHSQPLEMVPLLHNSHPPDLHLPLLPSPKDREKLLLLFLQGSLLLHCQMDPTQLIKDATMALLERDLVLNLLHFSMLELAVVHQEHPKQDLEVVHQMYQMMDLEMTCLVVLHQDYQDQPELELAAMELLELVQELDLLETLATMDLSEQPLHQDQLLLEHLEPVMEVQMEGLDLEMEVLLAMEVQMAMELLMAMVVTKVMVMLVSMVTMAMEALMDQAAVEMGMDMEETEEMELVDSMVTPVPMVTVGSMATLVLMEMVESMATLDQMEMVDSTATLVLMEMVASMATLDQMEMVDLMATLDPAEMVVLMVEMVTEVSTEETEMAVVETTPEMLDVEVANSADLKEPCQTKEPTLSPPLRDQFKNKLLFLTSSREPTGTSLDPADSELSTKPSDLRFAKGPDFSVTRPTATSSTSVTTTSGLTSTLFMFSLAQSSSDTIPELLLAIGLLMGLNARLPENNSLQLYNPGKMAI